MRQRKSEALEWRAGEGESPVAGSCRKPLSRFGLVEPGLNMGGPPSKPKYSSTTDSEPVRRLNDENHPCEGCEREAETMRLRAVGALHLRMGGDGVPFA